MLLKNFGVTRHGRLVFYDYDELCLLTDCRFRELPRRGTATRRWPREPWYFVGEHDVFPEEFRGFLGLRGERLEAFLAAHGDLLTPAFWWQMQDRLNRGARCIDVYPYRASRRLRRDAPDPVGPARPARALRGRDVMSVASGRGDHVARRHGWWFPTSPILPFIEGDGTGPDIWRAVGARVRRRRRRRPTAASGSISVAGGARRARRRSTRPAAGCPTRRSTRSARTSSASRARSRRRSAAASAR